MFERSKDKDKQKKKKRGRVLFFIVKKRDAVTLLNIIYKHIAPGTTIYSDCWKSYSRIEKLGKRYKHQTVNHDLYFVQPETKVNTNSIESNWCHAKAPIKNMKGVSRVYLESHLQEYTWRWNNSVSKVGAFEAMLELIAKHYQPGMNVEDM